MKMRKLFDLSERKILGVLFMPPEWDAELRMNKQIVKHFVENASISYTQAFAMLPSAGYITRFQLVEYPLSGNCPHEIILNGIPLEQLEKVHEVQFIPNTDYIMHLVRQEFFKKAADTPKQQPKLTVQDMSKGISSLSDVAKSLAEKWR
jgi:hypothetical protein